MEFSLESEMRKLLYIDKGDLKTKNAEPNETEVNQLRLDEEVLANEVESLKESMSQSKVKKLEEQVGFLMERLEEEKAEKVYVVNQLEFDLDSLKNAYDQERIAYQKLLKAYNKLEAQYKNAQDELQPLKNLNDPAFDSISMTEEESGYGGSQFSSVQSSSPDMVVKPKKEKNASETECKFKCGVCDKQFTNYKNFTNHLMNHVPKPSPEEIQDDDDYLTEEAETEAEVESDESEMETDESPKLKLGKFFAHVENNEDSRKANSRQVELKKLFLPMRKHFEAHLLQPKFSCDQCGKVYTRKHNLVQHVKVKHQNFTYKCQECNLEYSSRSNLDVHVKAKHKNVTYKCKDCDAEYKYRQEYTQHVRSKHLGVRHKCELCGKKFINKASLKDHIQSTHKKLKPFKCQDCNLKYARKQCLWVHRKRMHPERN